MSEEIQLLAPRLPEMEMEISHGVVVSSLMLRVGGSQLATGAAATTGATASALAYESPDPAFMIVATLAVTQGLFNAAKEKRRKGLRMRRIVKLIVVKEVII